MPTPRQLDRDDLDELIEVRLLADLHGVGCDGLEEFFVGTVHCAGLLIRWAGPLVILGTLSFWIDAARARASR
jgi:hypothetical protein